MGNSGIYKTKINQFQSAHGNPPVNPKPSPPKTFMNNSNPSSHIPIVKIIGRFLKIKLQKNKNKKQILDPQQITHIVFCREIFYRVKNTVQYSKHNNTIG